MSFSDFFSGEGLIELEIVGQQLIVIGNKPLNVINCDNMESVLCNNYLYTIYTTNDDELHFTFEKLCMETYTSTYIIDGATENTEIEVDQSKYKLRMSPRLFSFHHYQLVENDEFITDHVL